ncbi:MAG: FtsX-like permease family protein [Bacteroidota bacterium]
MLRSLNRNRLYAFVNIFGLAIGIACFTILALIIWHEWSYDRHHKKLDRIFRITERVEKGGVGENSSSVPFPLGSTLQSEYPDLIENNVRMFNFQVPLLSVSKGDKSYNESGFYFADSTFLDVFDFTLHRGDPRKVLRQSNEVLISARAAKKYLGGIDYLGDTLYFQGRVPMIVVGIFEENSSPSHFDFDFIASFVTLDHLINKEVRESWVWNPCWTYIVTTPQVEKKSLENSLSQFSQKYLEPAFPGLVSLDAQPLKDIHLYSRLDYEHQANSDIRYLITFGILGILILVIAALNFMQLAISNAALRAKEIAVRKVLGAVRMSLIQQFLLESLIVVGVSLLIAFILVEITLPYLVTLSGEPLEIHQNDWTRIAQVILGTGLSVAFLAGAYPAYFMSGFDPRFVFSGKRAHLPRRQHFNRWLVRLQFSISVMLLVFTLTNYKQIQFMRFFDLGFNPDYVLVVPLAHATQIRENYEDFTAELLQSEAVEYVSQIEDVIGKAHQTRPYFMKDSVAVFTPSLFVGKDIQQTVKLQLLAGSKFTVDTAKNALDQVFINKFMLQSLGYESPEAAIGKYLKIPHEHHALGTSKKIIRGVVENFHFTSLYEPMAPLVMEYHGEKSMYQKYLMIRTAPDREAEAEKVLNSVWKRFSTNQELAFFDLDDALSQNYRQEKILGLISGMFTVIAVMISMMGLFALSAFVVARREKEIGIRRTLGATTFSLILLLNREFLILVGQSILIGWGLALIVLYGWLTQFEFHIDPSPRIFLIATLFVLCDTFIAVSVHTVRAALRNPREAIQRGV